MSKKTVAIRYAIVLFVVLLMGLGWLVAFAVKGDWVTGIRMFALGAVIPGLFLAICWLADLREIDSHSKWPHANRRNSSPSGARFFPLYHPLGGREKS